MNPQKPSTSTMFLRICLPRGATLALALAALLPALAAAQASRESPDGWQYSATVYGYFPSIGGSTRVPVDSGGSNLSVDFDTIIDSLKMTFMGSFEARNGRWGVFTDLLYLDVGGDKSNTRDFNLGNTSIAASTTANLDVDLKATIWTLAGQYRIASDPTLKLDVLAGARYIDVKQRVRWEFTGDLGSLPAASRNGTHEKNEGKWDGIVGLKGHYALGEERKWSIPFYLDVGAGQSDSTWQAATGVGYAFRWGEVLALWRYVDYKFKSDSAVESLNLSGPMIGATLRW